MANTLLAMAGGHVFGSGVTFAALTLACTENMASSTSEWRVVHG